MFKCVRILKRNICAGTNLQVFAEDPLKIMFYPEAGEIHNGKHM